MEHINSNNYNVIKPLNTKKKHIFIRECMKQNIIYKHPGIAIFSGSQNSGKTTALIHILTNKYMLGCSNDNPKNEYRQYFDKIFLLIGSNDDAYNELIKNKLILKENVIKFPEPDDLKKIIENQENEILNKGIAKSDKILIVLDDCIHQRKFLNDKEMLKLWTQDRHINCSVFKPSRAVAESLTDQFCPVGVSKDTFKSIIKLATDNDENSSHNFLTIDSFNSNLNKKFRKNLDQYIIVDANYVEPKVAETEKKETEKEPVQLDQLNNDEEVEIEIVKPKVPKKCFKKLD